MFTFYSSSLGFLELLYDTTHINTYTAKNPNDKLVSTLAIYVDLEYLNSIRVKSYGDKSNKVMDSDPNRSY